MGIIDIIQDPTKTDEEKIALIQQELAGRKLEEMEPPLDMALLMKSAMRGGDLALFKFLLSQAPNLIEVKLVKELNLLQAALVYAKEKIIHHLLENKEYEFLRKEKNAEGNLLSHYYAMGKRNSAATLQQLIELEGKEIFRQPNEQGFYPVHLAIIHGCKEVLALLLEIEGVSLSPPPCGSLQFTAAHCAAHVGDTELLERIKEKYPQMLTMYSKSGFLPIHMAVLHNIDALRWHAENDDITGLSRDGRTALYLASELGKTEEVSLLLAKKAHVFNWKRGPNDTPYTNAVLNGRTAVAELFHNCETEMIEQAKTMGLNFLPFRQQTPGLIYHYFFLEIVADLPEKNTPNYGDKSIQGLQEFRVIYNRDLQSQTTKNELSLQALVFILPKFKNNEGKLVFFLALFLTLISKDPSLLSVTNNPQYQSMLSILRILILNLSQLSVTHLVKVLNEYLKNKPTDLLILFKDTLADCNFTSLTHYFSTVFNDTGEHLEKDGTERLTRLYDYSAAVSPFIKDFVLLQMIDHALIDCKDAQKIDFLHQIALKLLDQEHCELLLSFSGVVAINILANLTTHQNYKSWFALINQRCKNEKLVALIIEHTVEKSIDLANQHKQYALKFLIQLLSDMPIEMRQLIGPWKFSCIVAHNMMYSRLPSLLFESSVTHVQKMEDIMQLQRLMPRLYFSYPALEKFIQQFAEEIPRSTSNSQSINIFMVLWPNLFGELLKLMRGKAEALLIDYGILMDMKITPLLTIKNHPAFPILAFNSDWSQCSKRSAIWKMYQRDGIRDKDDLDKVTDPEHLIHLFYLMRAFILSHIYRPCLREATFIKLCDAFVRLVEILYEKNRLMGATLEEPAQNLPPLRLWPAKIEIGMISHLLHVGANYFTALQYETLARIKRSACNTTDQGRKTPPSLTFLASERVSHLWSSGKKKWEEGDRSDIEKKFVDMSSSGSNTALSPFEKRGLLYLASLFRHFKPVTQDKNNSRHRQVDEESRTNNLSDSQEATTSTTLDEPPTKIRKMG
ncbi:ankyrin repeat domain-containing protein [Legionella maceachernii]|uniref:Ankyrin repeats (3 copies) n=3 Tax=Legionella TaxID=445 RepID=A0A0W0WFY6_9GAMM|nr:ankyrin repeat domain-containing protein [Legionella maceachernii]KTD31260.1 Ankyrin repeats (3 copies) [Legionella maceachernii]SKA30449.1 Ankyrin repeat [Legionella maceachernii]SUP01755.1 Ankyrin repeats (3 copies) [Legionella maceachernii]